MAGLWPWGLGRIELPAAASLYYMPERPYLPVGTLRDAVCYHGVPQGCDDEAIASALERAGLGRIAHRLNVLGDRVKEPPGAQLRH